MKFISKNEKETAQIAANFVKTTLTEADFKGQATMVGLYGELGSGKTTFMKYVAETLGIKETITSPTFVLMRSFKLAFLNFSTLYHIDAYRIEKNEETLNLGWQKMISDPQNIIFIEWPERVAQILPEHIIIRFEHGSKEKQRKISIA